MWRSTRAQNKWTWSKKKIENSLLSYRSGERQARIIPQSCHSRTNCQCWNGKLKATGASRFITKLYFIIRSIVMGPLSIYAINISWKKNVEMLSSLPSAWLTGRQWLLQLSSSKWNVDENENINRQIVSRWIAQTTQIVHTQHKKAQLIGDDVIDENVYYFQFSVYIAWAKSKRTSNKTNCAN